MSFFEMYNGAVAVLKPVYRRNSDLPLFTPLKIVDMKFSVTACGETHQLNCVVDNQEIFFFLNAVDHARVLQYDGLNAVLYSINRQEHPYAVCVKKRSGLSTLILPSSAELIGQWSVKQMIKKSQIPESVRPEFDFEGLANLGIVLTE